MVDPGRALADFEEACRTIASRHLDQYERIIGLHSRDDEFREAVLHAICGCLLQHTLAPHLTRPSRIAKNLRQAHKSAEAACDHLRRLQQNLDTLEALPLRMFAKARGLRDEIARRSLKATIAWLERESELARLRAQMFKGLDLGGRPKMLAFEVLAKGLGDAFKIGTGRNATVTWNYPDSQWGGAFLKLVEVVLPLVKRITAPERFVTPNSPLALGQYLHRLTTQRSKQSRRKDANG